MPRVKATERGWFKTLADAKALGVPRNVNPHQILEVSEEAAAALIGEGSAVPCGTKTKTKKPATKTTRKTAKTTRKRKSKG